MHQASKLDHIYSFVLGNTHPISSEIKFNIVEFERIS